MKILISGGAGFLGRNLTQSFLADGHQVLILTRGSSVARGASAVRWDAKTINGWGHLANEVDVMIHLSGKSLASWPWTSSMKRAFENSRILPGRALVEAVQKAEHRPRLFIQQSGINHYGLHGDLANESTPAATDFLAQLTVKWESATKPVEELGLRRVILRSAPVLGKGGGLLALIALPIQLFIGGPLGNGGQAMPWIHLKDWIGAVRHLLDDENARGPYNLIAPLPTSNTEFNRALAEVLHRPYGFRVPSFLMRIFLGELSVLILDGRFAEAKRITEAGYHFQFPTPRGAFRELYRK